MSLDIIAESEIFKWGILPLFIILARVLDVSLGTIRIVFISRGLKYYAPLVGFFEVLIWLLTIRVIMQNLDNALCYIAYGAGFATGTFLGLQIEKRLSIGNSIIRIVTQKDASELINELQSKGFGVTSMDARGANGKVHVIYSIIKRQDFKVIAEAINKFNPKAFYTVEEIRFVREGIFPTKKISISHAPLIGLFRFWRKGK